MPSDLYNLNSSYGTEEELKYCIEEFHSQDLLVCHGLKLFQCIAYLFNSSICFNYPWYKN